MLKQIWTNSFIYRRLEEFVEAKSQKLIEKERPKIQCEVRSEIWEILKALGTESLIKKTHGILIKCYTDSLLSQSIFAGDFEKEELYFLQHYLRQGDTFLDIGSNVGLFSLIASPQVGASGRVVAFEPSSITHHRLKENITLNDFHNIETHQMALSNENATAELQIASGGYDAWNSLAKPSAGKVLETETVQTITLDAFINDLSDSAKISLLKIDVEGWEIPMVEGGKNFLSSDEAPTLMVEFTEQNAQNAGFSCKQLYELLVSYGYELFTYSQQENKLIPEVVKEYYPYTNLIATKSKKEVEKRLHE